MTPTEDRDLVEAARLGSAAAFERLVERYFGMVYIIAYSRSGHRETAEDLAQETFLRAWLCMDHLKDSRCFAPWITQIARNIAGEWQRKGNRRSHLATMVPLADLPREEIPDQRTQGADEIMENEERVRLLWQAVKQLPEDEREVVLLHYSEGLSKVEIAARLGAHPATVGRQIDRALKALRDSLDPLLQTLAPSVRPQQKAIVRAVTLIATATALSTATRTSLAATAATELAKVGALSTPSLPSASTGILALLKTISASVWTGGKIMGAGKAVGVIAAAAVLGGGVFYYAQGNGGGSGKFAKSEEKNPGVPSQLGAPSVPSEVNRQLVRLHKQERAKVDPSGVLPSICMVNVFREPDEIWIEAMMTHKYKETPNTGEISVSGGGGVAPVAILNEEGVPLKMRVTKNEPGPFGQVNYSFTLDKAIREGEEKTFCHVFPALKPGRQYYDDTVRALPDGTYAVTLKQMMGREGVQQHFLLVPPKYTFVKATEEPSLKAQAGEYALYGWTKHVTGQMEGVTATLKAK